MVGFGRISNSSELSCLSLLPVNMKRSAPKTAEKGGEIDV